jgi:glycosyltransferase involved in cell wall biosynthesis
VDITAHPQQLGSVIVPAHDESARIRRCLDALFAGIAPGELDVIVVCNGCRDDTAQLARVSGHPIRVIELDTASKPAALRAGDAAALALPRIYLDADVVLQGSAARTVLERLRAGAVAARPPIRYDSSGSSAPVRSYYRARSRVPALLGSLWGAGVYGLSGAGRSRFNAFPDVVADDLWVDRHFAPDEIEIVPCAPVVVTVPRSTRDLVRVLRRAYRGKAETADVDPHGRARRTTGSAVRQLRRLAAAGPFAALDAATYAAFAAGARLALASPRAGPRWERDDSSRAG